VAADGVLLVNLGTPEAPTVPAVRRYLAEFLSDPRVVELPRWLWLPILHGIVLRTRPAKSAAKYAAIWTPEGSPLAVHTRRQTALLRDAMPTMHVDYAMRYGAPSVDEGIARLRAAGAQRILALPLYPQFARSTTESVRDLLGPGFAMVEDFHAHPAYIAALAADLRRHWEVHGRGERLVMSFHGIPQRAVAKGDPYEVQCRESARRLADALELKDGEWVLTFQSRFGAAEWLQPYTQPTVEQLARSGIRRIDVICPGFVADCLETLEEIGMEVRHAFLAAGGTEFRALPCLNESPEWIAALDEIARQHAARA